MDIQESIEQYAYWKGTIGGQDYRKRRQTMSEDVQNVNGTRSTIDLLEWH